MAPSDDVAFAAHVDDFIRYLDGTRNMSPNTVRAYQTDLAAFCAWLERSGIDGLTVTHQQLRRYLAYLSRAQYTTRTINRHLSAIRGLYKWLATQGIVTADTAAALASPKVGRSLPRAMTDADVQALLATCDADDPESLRDRAFLELLYATGARISEMSGLDVADVDLGQLQVRLLGKGSKERIVPIYQTAADAVRRYLNGGRSQLVARANGRPIERAALFVSTQGRRMSAQALRTRFERHVREAGLDPTLTPHAMRHTYATELLDGGADLRSVQELLGHESLSTTQIYTHLSVERLKSATRQAHPRSDS